MRADGLDSDDEDHENHRQHHGVFDGSRAFSVAHKAAQPSHKDIHLNREPPLKEGIESLPMCEALLTASLNN